MLMMLCVCPIAKMGEGVTILQPHDALKILQLLKHVCIIKNDRAVVASD